MQVVEVESACGKGSQSHHREVVMPLVLVAVTAVEKRMMIITKMIVIIGCDERMFTNLD
jgi:hypothetical protein